MKPDLDTIQNLIRHQIDSGASFASIRGKRVLRNRRCQWSSGLFSEDVQKEREIWTISAMIEGTWAVSTATSFDLLQERQDEALQSTQQMLRYPHLPFRGKDALFPKAIRQIRHSSSTDGPLPKREELRTALHDWSQIYPAGTQLGYEDRHIEALYWDSEHTRGEVEFIKAEMDVELEREDSRQRLRLYHCEPVRSSLDLGSLPWTKDGKRWLRTLNEGKYTGPPPEDFPWIFSHRAFAQLVQGTLGPTLCLQRPDPFCADMNPASLDGTKIAPDILNINYQPTLFSDTVHLDEEGVPTRSLPLVSNGVLENFLMTRISSQYLSRSLPVNKNIVLVGCARIDTTGHQIFPDMRAIDVQPMDKLEKDLRLSHFYISDLEVTPINGSRDHYLVHVHHGLVNKFGGQHRRHIDSLRFTVTRNQLWANLSGLGAEQQRVVLPCRNAIHEEPYSFFNVPMAKFSGFPCSWN